MAASADQIEEVLRKDPGLLVELKRWIAKEASDRGQIVEDSDLTDQAVSDRLASDLEFRAVATRLLQRYGYLLPKLNPESDVAKEAELLRQQRVRRLLKAAEIEDEEAARGKRSEKESDLDQAKLRDQGYEREAGDQTPRSRERKRDTVTPAEAPPAGFAPTAYPQGAVFQRLEVRQLQEKSRQELIQRVEQEVTVVKVSLSEGAKEQAELQQAALRQREQVLEGLRKAPITGRLVVHLNSDLAAFENSLEDIEVRAGDSIYVPKRPDFVAVTGQVYNSNAISYEPRKTAAWYLRQAGGPTHLADRKAIFLIRADGSVVSGRSGGWWAGNVLSTPINPGDTLVVPEKPIAGGTFWKNFLGVAQVAQSAAITAAVVTR